MRTPVQGLVALFALCPASGVRAGSPAGATHPVEPARAGVKGEEAIRHGLCWLARHQEADGSWGFASLFKRCKGERSCFINVSNQEPTDFHNPGLTGLAILAFLRAGYGPNSQAEIVDPVTYSRIKPGDATRKGLAWLKKTQRKDGGFSPVRSFMYNESLCALALVGAFAATKDEAWREPAQRAVDFVQDAQYVRPDGTGLSGWRYIPRKELEARRSASDKEAAMLKEMGSADTSVTGWATAVLAAARDCGLQTKRESIEGAVAFCRSMVADDGRVGYLDRAAAGVKISGTDDHFDYHAGTMCALAMGILLDGGRSPKDPLLETFARHLIGDLPAVDPKGLSVDYYYWYHGSLALDRFVRAGGVPKAKATYSAPWNKAAVEALLGLQNRTKGSCSHGGWLIGDRWCLAGGPAYCTAMAVLSLAICDAPR